MSDPSITIYTTRWCGDCRRAKTFLEHHGVVYEEINIEQRPEAAELVMAKNDGKRRVPTFEIDGRWLGNPPISELSRQLGLSG